MTDLDELERLLADATPGPWGLHEYVPKGGTHVMIWDEPTQRKLMCIECVSREDAALIVTLRSAAPALIAELKALRKQVADMKACDVKVTVQHRGMKWVHNFRDIPTHAADGRATALSELIALSADEYDPQAIAKETPDAD